MTVGVIEDSTVSRMTISLTSDGRTSEQMQPADIKELFWIAKVFVGTIIN